MTPRFHRLPRRVLLFGLLPLLAHVALAAFAAADEPPLASREATRLFVEGAYEESQGRDGEAYRLYHHAYLIDPESPSILFAMARLALRQGDLRLATEHAGAAVRLEPDHHAAQLLLGTALELQGRGDEARPHLERAVELDTLDAASVVALARHCERAREPERALALYQQAHEIEPDDDELLLRIATLLTQLGRPEEAAPYLERLREADPENPTLALSWAWVQDELGRPDLAIPGYEEHLQAFPADVAARRRLVNAYLAEDRAEDALPHAELLYRQAHGIAEAGVYAGTLIRLGRMEDARTLAREVRAEAPGNLEAAELALRVLSRAGEKDLAADEMERLTQEIPSNFRAWLLRAASLEATGRRADAVAAVGRAEKVAPDSLGALLEVADAYAVLESAGETDRLLLAALEREPESPRVWYAVATARERRKDFEGAEAAIRRVLEVDPESPQALNFLGYLYADYNRNLEEAVRLIRRALSFDPENGYIVDSLGWAYYRMGELDSARVELERALDLSGEDPVILEHLGDVQTARQDRPEALRRYGRALELDPDNAALKRKLEASR